MSAIDCFLVGHNELSIAQSKRMLLYMYGKDSHEYRDRAKYTVSQIAVDNRRLTPTEVFNHVRRGSAWRRVWSQVCVVSRSSRGFIFLTIPFTRSSHSS